MADKALAPVRVLEISVRSHVRERERAGDEEVCDRKRGSGILPGLRILHICEISMRNILRTL